ncbi:MAG: hypothetical protein ACTHO8_07475 [Solirubrobacterales bacterium]
MPSSPTSPAPLPGSVTGGLPGGPQHPPDRRRQLGRDLLLADAEDEADEDLVAEGAEAGRKAEGAPSGHRAAWPSASAAISARRESVAAAESAGAIRARAERCASPSPPETERVAVEGDGLGEDARHDRTSTPFGRS